MKRRFRRLAQETVVGQSRVKPGVISGLFLLFAGLFLIGVSLGLGWFVSIEHNRKLVLIDGAGARVDRAEPISSVVRSHRTVLSYFRKYLEPRREGQNISAIKEAFPDLFEGVYFDSVSSLFTYTASLSLPDVSLEAYLVYLHGEHSRAKERCAADPRCQLPSGLKDGDAAKATKILANHVIPSLFEVFEDPRFSPDTRRRLIESILAKSEILDFSFDFDSSIQRSLSRSLLVIGFLEASDGSASQSYLTDLRRAFTSGRQSVPIELISTETIRFYKSAIGAYYDGCYVEVGTLLDKFEAMTGNRVLLDLAWMLRVRAYSRPFIQGAEAVIFDERHFNDGCGGRHETEKWLVMTREAISVAQQKATRLGFQDDFVYLERELTRFSSKRNSVK